MRTPAFSSGCNTGFDTTLAADVWLDSPDVSFIHPLGHEHGFEQIKQNVYTRLMGDNFSERKLSIQTFPSIFSATPPRRFYWDFAAKFRKDGSPLTTHGRETQLYQKIRDRWRLVHVHYFRNAGDRGAPGLLNGTHNLQQKTQEGQGRQIDHPIEPFILVIPTGAENISQCARVFRVHRIAERAACRNFPKFAIVLGSCRPLCGRKKNNEQRQSDTTPPRHVIQHEGQLFTIFSVDHRTPGKQAGSMQTRMRNLAPGRSSITGSAPKNS